MLYLISRDKPEDNKTTALLTRKEYRFIMKVIQTSPLKDYDYVILWLDYFNKNLTRTKGRKIKKEQAIFDPTLSDLLSAAKESGFDPKNDQINDGARYPRRAFVKSGYIALPKNKSYKKNKLIITLAQRMLKNRTDRSRH